MCGFFKKMLSSEPEVYGITKGMEELAQRIPLKEYERLVQLEMEAIDKLPIKSEGSTYIKWGKKKGDQWVYLTPWSNTGTLDRLAYLETAIDLFKKGSYPPGLDLNNMCTNKIQEVIASPGIHSDDYSIEVSQFKTTFNKKNWNYNEDRFLLFHLTHEMALQAKSSGKSILMRKSHERRDCPACKERASGHKCGYDIWKETDNRLVPRTSADRWERVTKPKLTACPDCHGVGGESVCDCFKYLISCPSCRGTGRANFGEEGTIWLDSQGRETHRDVHVVEGWCTACDGTRWKVGPICPECGTDVKDMTWRCNGYTWGLFGVKNKCKKCRGDGYVDCPICNDHDGNCSICGGKNDWLVDLTFYKVDVKAPSGNSTAVNIPLELVHTNINKRMPYFYKDPKDLWLVLRSQSDCQAWCKLIKPMGDQEAKCSVTNLSEQLFEHFKGAKVSVPILLFIKFQLAIKDGGKTTDLQVLVIPGRYCAKVHKFFKPIDDTELYKQPPVEEPKVNTVTFEDFVKMNWLNPPVYK
jgi:DnaJ-class molecular chaperone